MEELIGNLKDNEQIDKIYGLRFDSSFKSVYRNEELLKNLFRILFHEKIPTIKCFRDKELVKDNVNLRCGVCDLVVETKNKILLIEVQNKNLKDFKKRIKRYVSILYATQKFEENYNEIKTVKVYMILNYKEGKSKVLKCFSELEKDLKEKFDILSEIKVWNIQEALETLKGLDYKCAKLYVLDQYPKEEALNILKESLKDKRLKEVVEKIIIYNLDLETYQRLKEEEMMIETTFEFETSGLRMEAERKARREGRKKGLQEGLREGIEVGKREGIEVGKREGIEVGKREGIELGKKEGKREGVFTGKLETAANLLKVNVPIELIAQATNLSIEQIRKYTKV